MLFLLGWWIAINQDDREHMLKWHSSGLNRTPYVMCLLFFIMTVFGCLAMRMSQLVRGCLQWMSTMRTIKHYAHQSVHHHLLLCGIFLSAQVGVSSCSNKHQLQAIYLLILFFCLCSSPFLSLFDKSMRRDSLISLYQVLKISPYAKFCLTSVYGDTKSVHPMQRDLNRNG